MVRLFYFVITKTIYPRFQKKKTKEKKISLDINYMLIK